jgi:hypothetical protein
MQQTFSFDSLAMADLVIDAVYEGGKTGNTADDPIGKVVPGAGNQGGFRQVGGWTSPKAVVLYSSADDPDSPDFVDIFTGVFTYFGDNKEPGKQLHDTQRRGNELLRYCFDILHNEPDQRIKIPPFLVFTKGGKGRDVVFRGLAVPGIEGDAEDDLVAIWRSKHSQRFQNYRAKFTILDAGTLSRQWLNALRAGDPLHSSARLAHLWHGTRNPGRPYRITPGRMADPKQRGNFISNWVMDLKTRLCSARLAVSPCRRFRRSVPDVGCGYRRLALPFYAGLDVGEVVDFFMEAGVPPSA